MRVRAFGVFVILLALLVASSRTTVWSKGSGGGEAARANNASSASLIASQSRDVAIIVNQKNSASDISFDVLRKYFKAERGQWPNGTKVVIAMRQPPGQSERGAILRSIYGWDENYYQKYFRQGQFNESIQQLPK